MSRPVHECTMEIYGSRESIMFVDVKHVGSIVFYESAFGVRCESAAVDRCAFLFKKEDIRADG